MKTAPLFGSKKEALAVIGVENQSKASSRQTLLDLYALQINPVLFSEDNQFTATLASFGSGNANIIHGKLLLQERLAAIGEMIDRSDAVGVVGADQRDVPAMIQATMRIAIGPVEKSVKDNTQVEVPVDDLGELTLFLALCRQMMQSLKRHMALSLGLNGLLLTLAAAGRLTLWMSTLGDLASAGC